MPLAVWQFFTVNMDEPRYTVAAAEMMASGDYLVPTNPWGGVRLLKPPLSYYYVVGGFSLFGQSLFGAKLFWLLSSAAILGFTWALARRIGASQAGAAVAVAALAANLHFYRAALTHIPDIPQMLGITHGARGLRPHPRRARGRGGAAMGLLPRVDRDRVRLLRQGASGARACGPDGRHARAGAGRSGARGGTRRRPS